MKWLTLCSAATLVVAVSAEMSQSISRARPEWGAMSAGLRMAISSAASGDQRANPLQFHVAIENVGDRDVVLNLGFMLANGKLMFPEAIRLILTDALGTTRELRYFDRRDPGIAGRVDDFTVALRSGSTYVLRARLDHYWSPAAKEFTLRLSDGRYSIAARFEGQGASAVTGDMQGIALMNFWKGTLDSNSIDFEVSGDAALR